MFAHRYREHGWRQPRRLRSSSIHPTQGTQFRGPRDAPSRAQRMPSRRRSVGRSVSAGAKTGTTRTGWRAAGQGAWSTPALPPHVALPCPARRCHVIQPIPFGSPTCFFAFHGDKEARGLSCFWLASWPVRPSVGCGTVPAGTYPFPSGRRMHACRLPPAGKDLDLTVSPSWEGRPSLASGHAACLPACSSPSVCLVQFIVSCKAAALVVRRTWAARGVDRGLFHPSHACLTCQT
jgi:hypothetical protein